MTELVFVKLGGSIITDKRAVESASLDVIHRLAEEIAVALEERPDLSVVLGHGSGSFGHIHAARYGVRKGCPDGDMTGYVLTGAAAGRLNTIVTDALVQAGVLAVSVQPSVLVQCSDGAITSMETTVIEGLMQRHCVPLVYGDVALDSVRGCTIVSTEMVFERLVELLQPSRVLMVGQVDGVFTGDPLVDPKASRIEHVSLDTYVSVRSSLSAASGIDVTGGMLTKIDSMMHLVSRVDGLSIRILSGAIPGQLRDSLLDGDYTAGTLLTR